MGRLMFRRVLRITLWFTLQVTSKKNHQGQYTGSQTESLSSRTCPTVTCNSSSRERRALQSPS